MIKLISKIKNQVNFALKHFRSIQRKTNRQLLTKLFKKYNNKILRENRITQITIIKILFAQFFESYTVKIWRRKCTKHLFTMEWAIRIDQSFWNFGNQLPKVNHSNDNKLSATFETENQRKQQKQKRKWKNWRKRGGKKSIYLFIMCVKCNSKYLSNSSGMRVNRLVLFISIFSNNFS